MFGSKQWQNYFKVTEDMVLFRQVLGRRKYSTRSVLQAKSTNTTNFAFGEAEQLFACLVCLLVQVKFKIVVLRSYRFLLSQSCKETNELLITNGPVASGQEQNVNSILVHITRHLHDFSKQKAWLFFCAQIPALALTSLSASAVCACALARCVTTHHGRKQCLLTRP